MLSLCILGFSGKGIDKVNPALPLTSHVTLGQLPDVSESQISHLCSGTVVGDYMAQNLTWYSLSGSSSTLKLIPQ